MGSKLKTDLTIVLYAQITQKACVPDIHILFTHLDFLCPDFVIDMNLDKHHTQAGSSFFFTWDYFEKVCALLY